MLFGFLHNFLCGKTSLFDLVLLLCRQVIEGSRGNVFFCFCISRFRSLFLRFQYRFFLCLLLVPPPERYAFFLVFIFLSE